MNSFMLISKVRIDETFSISKMRHEKDVAKKVLYHFSTVVKVAIFVAVAFAVYYFSKAMAAAEYANILPIISYIVGSVISLIMTIVKINEKVSGRSDTDFLLSLPASNTIQIALLFIELYIEAFVYVILFAIPMGIAYAGATSMGGAFWARWVIGVLFTSLPVSGFASLFGIIIALLLSSAKNRNLIQSIISLTAIGFIVSLMFYIAYRVGLAINSGVGSSPKEICDNIIWILSSQYRFCRIYQNAIVDGSALYMLLFILVSIVCYAFCTFALSVAYRDFMLALKAPLIYKRFEMSRQNANSLIKTIFKREISLFLRSKTYMTKSLVGFLVGIIVAIGVCIIGEGGVHNAFFPNGINFNLTYYLVCAICILVATCSTTFCSLSIEGSRIWIWQTSPTPDRLIYGAKMAISLIINVTLSLVCGILLSITFKMGAIQVICMILIPLLYSVICAVWGLLAERRFADYEIQSENQIMTQSLSFAASKLPQILIPVVLIVVGLLVQ